MSLSAEDRKALCQTIYMHILALRKYDLSSLERIRTSIVLLKPTISSVHMTEEDYGLHKVLSPSCLQMSKVLIFRNRYLITQYKKLFRLRETKWKCIMLKATILQC